ncbi:MAG: Nif3-like dinuclear metal center hexameric protein [Chlamydiia bacterium]|nr:Nif3-like dinuclear metal center hexameric protein [Chlamydiia bacterium]
MSIELKQLISLVSNYLEVSSIPDHCPNGLQVEGKFIIKRAATAVSASFATIQEAVNQKIDALIVHHGIFWRGDEFPIVGGKKKKIELLLQNQISLLAYHLPLDAHREVGNNWKAASDFGWRNLVPFGEFNGMTIGVMGSFNKIPITVFTAEMEAYYEHIAYAAYGGKKEVKRAALVSGGAYKAIQEAARAGADCFVTGNFDEPVWGMAFEEEINFLALGHTATEKVGPKALGKWIEKKGGILCPFIDSNNPF